MTVAEAYCARHHCPSSRFEDRVFRECVHSHAAPLASLLFSLIPKRFHEDRVAIQQVGLARTLEEVDTVLSDFNYINHSRPDWVRTSLKIRISGRKLRLLAASLLEIEQSGGRADLPVLATSQPQPPG
jgi:hypothetical protein